MTLIRNVYRKTKAVLHKPIWVNQPEHLQFDTQNTCNLNCEYCNVKINGCYKLPRGVMPTETYEAVLRYYGHNLGLWCVAPFMNGEPLLDPRLPSLVSKAKEITGAPCAIDTNGTVTRNRQFLLHPNLTNVRFTISAATPETYLKVHGKDLFNEAVNNFRWFNKNKHPNQTAWLHFITTENNVHETEAWLNLFQGCNRTVFPVHTSPLQKNSIKSKSHDWQPRPYAVLSDGTKTFLKPEPSNSLYPCPCWAIMGISWRGEILQCVDYPYKYNYGKVGEVDLTRAWRERNKVGFDNDCCRDCSLKFSNGNNILNSQKPKED